MTDRRILAFTGHRPNKLGGYRQNPMQMAVRSAIRQCIFDYKPEKVISGMALGVDQWAAEECVDLGVQFVAAVPFVGQERCWPEESQRRYQSLLECADDVVVVCSGGYAPEKMQQRNKWMVDNCTRLFAVWDGSLGGTANCVRYAERVGREIDRFDPRTLTK